MPFWIVENPFFIDLIKSLCPGFQLPKRSALSTTMVNKECANILIDTHDALAKENNLTLGKYNLIYIIINYIYTVYDNNFFYLKNRY